MERGFYTSMRGEPNWLPIPFPRFFTKKTFGDDGRIRLSPELKDPKEIEK
jgi:hypothetical protein